MKRISVSVLVFKTSRNVLDEHTGFLQFFLPKFAKLDPIDNLEYFATIARAYEGFKAD